MAFGARIRSILQAAKQRVTPLDRRIARAQEQQAESLNLIARALTVIVQREYRVDLLAPPLTAREQRVPVFEPIYADNEGEAIREHVEMLRVLELDTDRATRVRDGDAGDDEPRAGRAVEPRLSTAPSSGADEPLTVEERQWLAELEGEGDGGGDR